jgi:CRISPR system Cascade subunit CasC
MSRFIQLHALTAYPPANLNRDDTGRPKTALLGDALRLRVSSQSLKRAWRTSSLFGSFLPSMRPQIGTRTKQIGTQWIFPKLVADGVDPDSAKAWSVDLQRAYGEPEAENKEQSEAELQNTQLVHVSPVEVAKLAGFVDALSAFLRFGTVDESVDAAKNAIDRRNKSQKQDKKKANATLARELAGLLLVDDSTSVDVAMFGRMLATAPRYNFEAAVQVAHAVTVHKAAVEDDYFSAVDDLNQGLEDKGAGHIGERGYGAGLFYLYLCINRELLQDNLGGDAVLTGQALQGLLHAVTQVAPTGMQNSFGSRARASYLLAEKGSQQPRSLVQAFLKPVKPYGEQDMLALAVAALEQRRENFDRVYGACADARCHFDVERGEGSLAEVVAFVQG